MEDLYVETQVGRVFGKMAGEEGRPLILGIHGYSQRNGWHTWERMMQPLADAGYWVVSLDMPGWGKSVTKRPLQSNGFVQCVVDVIEELEMETAVLLGKSWGGGIALETAIQFPQKITKLILTAPARQNFDPLVNLKQPVLMAWAEDDQVIPIHFSIKYSASIPDLQLELYPTGGHSAAQKNATDFAPKAIKFLEEPIRS